MTKEVRLTKGYVAIVDDCDYALVSRFTWRTHVKKSGAVYALTHVRGRDGKQTSLSMHRLILGDVSPDIQVDHVNGYGLDNRRENLRYCASAQNARNRRTPRTNTSGIKGVSWYERDKKWQAVIGFDNKDIHLGCFAYKEDAAAAYRAAAVKYHGEFARFE